MTPTATPSATPSRLQLPQGALPAFDVADPPSFARRAKVLFVISAGRSGSTLLDRLMGQYPNVTAIGELAAIWEVGLRRNLHCGCGRPFRECPMWTSVLSTAFGDLETIDPIAMEDFWRQNDQMFGEHFRNLLTPEGRRRLRNQSDASIVLDSVIGALADETGADLVVDTSKSVFHAWFAQGSPVIEPYVLHLVRDPRAVVYSWTRPASDINEGIDMPDKSMMGTAAWWVAINRAAAVFERDVPERYLRLRYEDFVDDPGGSTEAIGRFCGVDLDGEWLRAGGSLDLHPTHAGCGNPLRYATALTVRSDERWRTQMPAWRRAAVAASAWPWARRYGYGLS